MASLPVGQGTVLEFPPIPDPDECEFARHVRELGLVNKREMVLSISLRFWAQVNADRKYVPEWLLEVWGIAVEPVMWPDSVCTKRTGKSQDLLRAI